MSLHYQFGSITPRIPSFCTIKGHKARFFLCLAALLGLALPIPAQPFSISSARLTGGVIQITFPGRSDSYYFLSSSPTVTASSQPVLAVIGINGSQAFQTPVTGSATFFRVEQIPLTSTSSLLPDGIPDGWKLQHGLNPFGPSVANQLATGYALTWLQVYQQQARLF